MSHVRGGKNGNKYKKLMHSNRENSLLKKIIVSPLVRFHMLNAQ